MALAKYKRISLEGIGAGWTDEAWLEIDTPDPEKLKKAYPNMAKILETRTTGLSPAQQKKAVDSLPSNKALKADTLKFMQQIVVRGKVFATVQGKPRTSDNIMLIDLVEADYLDLFHLAGDLIIEYALQLDSRQKKA